MKKTDRGFGRVRQLAAATSMGIAGLLGGGATSARAATTAIPISTLSRGGAKWYHIGNSFGDHSFAQVTMLSCTTTAHCSTSTDAITEGSEPFGIRDASVGGRGDAFDSMLGVSVNGAAFVAPGGVVDLTGDTVTAGPVTLSGLSAEVRYEFFSSRPMVRALYSFTNPTGSPINATVVIGGEDGSDDDALVQGTASGDTTITNVDGWYVTSDGTPPGSDPDITVCRFTGAGSVKPTTNNVPGSGANDYFSESFDIVVPAGGTVRLAMFVEISTSVANALSGAQSCNDEASMAADGLLANLSEQEISEIANISAGGVLPPQPAAIPVLSTGGKLTLAAVLALLGTLTVRRYRRRREESSR